MAKHIAVFGSSGAIGGALTKQLVATYPSATIHAFSRQPTNSTATNHVIDYENESVIADAATKLANIAPLDLVIVATGMLHDEKIMPEKSLRDLSYDKFERLFKVNTALPALIAKHFIPTLNRNNPSIFAALSARVGSISDNQLGGWYAYRASKAALNMVIKNAAIETARSNKHAIIVGLHPGTVDSHLSSPFQKNVKDGKLFTPEYSAKKLIEVLSQLTPNHSGRCFAWDKKEITL